MDAFTKETLAHLLSDSLEIDFVLETVQTMHQDYSISLSAEIMINQTKAVTTPVSSLLKLPRILAFVRV